VVLAVGPPGTGKTHICTALGLEACRRGRRVRFVTVADLVIELAEAQAEHRLSRLEQQLDHLDLLILDESGSSGSAPTRPSCCSSRSPIATRAAPWR
jgi:DNA replication protein DnaC